MRVKVIQGRVEADSVYQIGDEFELPESEARSLLNLVPSPIELIQETPEINPQQPEKPKRKS